MYVPEVVSRGLVPEDLGSFYRQQIKWARGVYEVLFSDYPSAFRGLGWWQRLSYLAIGTYYLVGLTTLMYLILPYLYLWTGIQPAAMPFPEFVTMGGPVALVGLVMYRYAQRWLCHPETEKGLHWRSLALKIAAWPIYLLGTVLAIFRVRVPYIPTAKEARRGRFMKLAAPHLMLAALYAVTLVWTLYDRLALTPEGALVLSCEAVWGMVGFATMALIMATGGIYAAWESRRLPPEKPWDGVVLENIETGEAEVLPDSNGGGPS